MLLHQLCVMHLHDTLFTMINSCCLSLPSHFAKVNAAPVIAALEAQGKGNMGGIACGELSGGLSSSLSASGTEKGSSFVPLQLQSLSISQLLRIPLAAEQMQVCLPCGVTVESKVGHVNNHFPPLCRQPGVSLPPLPNGLALVAICGGRRAP